MPPDVSALRDFALRYTAAWCSHNPAAVASFYAPSGRLSVNDDAPAVGREAIAQLARSFMDAFPDLRVAMDDLRLNSDRIEYHWTLTGTHAGPGGSGSAVRISSFELWQIGDDGLIAASRGHFDAADYQRQLHARSQ
jgi:predicted ester cyclase